MGMWLKIYLKEVLNLYMWGNVGDESMFDFVFLNVIVKLVKSIFGIMTSFPTFTYLFIYLLLYNNCGIYFKVFPRNFLELHILKFLWFFFFKCASGFLWAKKKKKLY